MSKECPISYIVSTYDIPQLTVKLNKEHDAYCNRKYNLTERLYSLHFK